MSYYQQHKEQMIERQLAYYRNNREKYLAYMREYRIKHYVPKPRVKKEKAPKEPKPPKPPKEPKPPKAPKEHKIATFVAPEPIITTARGNFTLSFI